MKDSPLDPATFTDDPEIAALLDFAPVPRKCIRADGWWPEIQYHFIVGVAETGKPDQVAHALGTRTLSGAWKLRKAGGGEGFAKAWDKAKALYRERNPPVRRPFPPPPPPRQPRIRPHKEPLTPEEEARERADLFKALMKLYDTKLKAERRCRLEGRIVAADFYVRQATCIELAADLSGHGGDLLAALQRGGVRLTNAVATPLSFYFDYLRRSRWVASGEPDRPELPRFGRVGDGIAAAPETTYNIVEAGMDFADWRRHEELDAAAAAEAQRRWEEKARADSARWHERLERDDPETLAAILGTPELELAPDYAEELVDPSRSSPANAGEWDSATRGGGASSIDPEPTP